jgi:endonuclease YncB( thermonuclease family)
VRVAGRRAFALACSAMLLLAPAPCDVHGGEAEPQQVRVRKVIDADTLEVEAGDGTTARVRLLGVDAPEVSHPRRPLEYQAEEALRFVRRLCEGRAVGLLGDPRADDRDSFGRLLRYVRLPDGRLLNAELLREGYAFAFVRFPFAERERFERYERDARERRVGVWGRDGLDEVAWGLRRGREPFRIHAMSNRDWAVQWGRYVKPHVRSAELASELQRLLGWVHEHEGPALEHELARHGYKRLDP